MQTINLQSIPRYKSNNSLNVQFYFYILSFIKIFNLNTTDKLRRGTQDSVLYGHSRKVVLIEFKFRWLSSGDTLHCLFIRLYRILTVLWRLMQYDVVEHLRLLGSPEEHFTEITSEFFETFTRCFLVFMVSRERPIIIVLWCVVHFLYIW